MTRRVLAILVFIALCLPAHNAAAQTTPEQQVSSVVKPGQRLFVTMADGKVRTGSLREVRPGNVVLSVRGSARLSLLPIGDIRRIEVEDRDPVSDSVKRGAWIGLAIGGGVGTLFAIAWCSGFDDCAGGYASAALLAGMGLGIGAGIGAVGDSLINDTRIVWPVPTGSSARPVTFGLMAGPRRAGIGFTIRW